MAGELIEVLGKSAWFQCGSVPASVKGKKFTLKSSDGETFDVEAAGLAYARKTMQQAVELGADAEIELPFKKPVVAKLVEYFKFHADSPPSEIRTPLESDNLVECGASKWDAGFINCDKDLMFELMVAAAVMDIPSLTFLAGAKASLLIKGKEPSKLLKDFKLNNDLPEDEEETLNGLFNGQKEAVGATPDESGLTGIAVLMTAVFQAAEKNDIYSSVKGDAPAPSAVSLKSSRMAQWRAMVLSDWNQLQAAPEEIHADRDLIFAALGPSRGNAINFAASELREDKKLFLEVVKYNGWLFEQASMVLRSDPDFVKEAIAVNGEAMWGASDDLKGNKDFLLEACAAGCGKAVSGALDSLKSNKDFILDCVRRDPIALKYASEDLRNDKNFILEVVSICGSALQYAPFNFQADRVVAKAAVASDPTAITHAHVSARVDMGSLMPWDSEADLLALKKEQDSHGIGGAPRAPGGARFVATPLSKEQAKEHDVWCVFRTRTQKHVQFSALSTMTANMGQSNYIAANCWLDKLPFYERPEHDGVVLMWGAVGNIGMRWKAFASADFLNANPEALMQVPDAAKVLNITATRMDPPEWYAASFFDEWSRQSMLAPTAGVHKGENIAVPQPPQEKPKERKQLEEKARTVIESGPLGGWPALGVLPEKADEEAVDEELAEGDRVVFHGLQNKNGQMGTLLRLVKCGRWKVQMDAGGNALLKDCYLKKIGVADMQAVEASREEAAALRKQRTEERRARIQAAA